MNMEELDYVERLGRLEGTVKYQLYDDNSALNRLDRIIGNMQGINNLPGTARSLDKMLKEMRRSLERGIGDSDS